MEAVRMRDFRCFAGEHEAQLRPLTLLVGKNSTGKTSFMAMIRALWEVAYQNIVPNFKEPPFDLGSFEDMANRTATRQATSFAGGFTERHVDNSGDNVSTVSFDTTFRRLGTVPIPVERSLSDDAGTSCVVSQTDRLDGKLTAVLSALKRTRHETAEVQVDDEWGTRGQALTPLFFVIMTAGRHGKNPELSESTHRKLKSLTDRFMPFYGRENARPFAGAPVRSRPSRTYDPGNPARDPEGRDIPAYLAEVNREGGPEWSHLKASLEQYGEMSGLFQELAIQPKGEAIGDPFQVKIRHFPEDPLRNLMDMGYGVNQILPLITELSRSDSQPISLVQQPEVHLHPTAQAALGTLFCQMAEQDHQLIIETHSDHLVNRVRLDIRDGTTNLTADDVSLLYFEREGSQVTIHSLQIDQQGNIDAPPSYGQFFMEEVNRELRI